MRNTRWIYKEKGSYFKNSKYSKDILSILEERGVSGEEDIQKFINAELKDLRDPFDLKDMHKTVELILNIKKQGKSICIYGDYDVDGVTSTTVLYLVFKEMGMNVDYYIPLRDEGYGLNKEAIKEIKGRGADLIITVDCGISSVEEVEYANEIGMDIVITDHHDINNKLPEAIAVINCKRKDNKFSFDKLAGVGTAFMLALALYRKLDMEDKIYKYIDLVAIGTVADIVPLVEDNRIIVKNGLKFLENTKWRGLKCLLRKLYENSNSKEYNTYDIGFRIAPIFNAAGRLEDAKKSVRLLISEDNKECDIISYELLNNNKERKEIQENILSKVECEVENKKLFNQSSIVVAGENFHSGVIGIVASKIVDKYYKPTVILDIKKEEGIAIGSCRSIEGFNIIQALNSMKELFLKYGGHAGAAGLSIDILNIEEFTKRLNKYVEEHLGDKFLLKPIKIDKRIGISKISYDFLDELSLLEPFGFGNSMPIFSIENCTYLNLRKIGKERNHLMFNLVKNEIEIKNCVWFNAGDMYDLIGESYSLNVAFKLKMERYKNRYQYKIFVEDIKKSIEDSEYLNTEAIKNFEIYDVKFPIKTVFYTRKEISDNLNLVYNEGRIYVTDRKITVGELDEVVSYILTKGKEYFGYNFKISLEKIITTDENFNIYIKIDKYYGFETYKLKDGEIFTEIKNYLLGELNYNLFQKKILRGVFKEKENILGIYKNNRGIGILIKTISLYYKSIGKKCILVTKSNSYKRNDLENYIEISNEIKEGYDFYIYLDFKAEKYFKNSLILNKKEIEIIGFKRISDDYEKPINVEIMEEKDLIKKQDVWSKKLSRIEKINTLNKLKSGKKIFATENIKVIF
ncbi:single-stranded-DNA-specific exonuclease RecJ [Fusobacterium sp. MFO224]|uniref:single-stranded-DNA-specific exonuclease RecJ n=1 Tax=Fusobacterium sp. MFO224 TaxID=3378070 RepID=UPI0038541C32